MKKSCEQVRKDHQINHRINVVWWAPRQMLQFLPPWLWIVEIFSKERRVWVLTFEMLWDKEDESGRREWWRSVIYSLQVGDERNSQIQFAFLPPVGFMWFSVVDLIPALSDLNYPMVHHVPVFNSCLSKFFSYFIIDQLWWKFKLERKELTHMMPWMQGLKRQWRLTFHKNEFNIW